MTRQVWRDAEIGSLSSFLATACFGNHFARGTAAVLELGQLPVYCKVRHFLQNFF